MGTRGPLPKRDAERAGHNAKSERADQVRAFATVPVPEADPYWHADAKEWYDSLAISGQSRFYEPSDWQFARVVATMLSDLLNADRPTAEMFKAIDAAMDKLAVTESARRRQRIEVERPASGAEFDPAAGDAARVAVMERYRSKAAGGA